jgi:hypothetical protein
MTVNSKLDGLVDAFRLLSHLQKSVLDLHTPDSYKSCTTHYCEIEAKSTTLKTFRQRNITQTSQT